MKMLHHALLNIFLREVLARKNIQVHIVGFFHEVSDDVRSMDQLNKCISRLITSSKMFAKRLSEWLHINVFDEFLGKRNNIVAITNG